MSFEPEHVRFDIIIPLRYNNKKKIEEWKHKLTKDELIEKFGACTFLTTSEGRWIDNKNSNKLYIDINTCCFVITPKAREAIRFFQKYRKTLQKRYRQRKIQINYYPVREV